MQINKINVNNYGNLSNKEIKLESKINLIYGKNEAGKSTLLNFIESMFFGANKNKNNKPISDFEKYEPWNNQEYSGTMDYQLSSGEEFYIYRDFRKKNPQILDKMGKDISKNFNIDKKNGNLFFTDQTGLDRSLIKSSIITEQNQVEIDEGTQNQLLQKIANLSESGEEELSYKKVIDKLNKMLLNEIGTDRSQLKPINITKDNIQTYQNKIDEIRQHDDERFKISEEINEIQNKINDDKKRRDIYSEIKKVIDNDKIEQEKIDEKERIIRDNSKKINQYEEELKRKEKEKTETSLKDKKIKITISIVLLLLALLTFYLTRKIIFGVIFIILIPFIIFYKNQLKSKDNTYEIQNKIDILNETNSNLKAEISKMQQELYKKDEEEKQRIIQKSNDNEISVLFNSKIEDEITKIVKSIEQDEIAKHKLEIDEKEIEKNYENLVEYEENIEIEKRKLEELEHKQKIIKLTMEILEQSYEDMKENVSPKFNKNLSKNIEIFSNGKYKEIIISDKIFIKLENGEIIPIESVSMGTIEQIYLAFRISVINEISNEKMPILLDEAFAYYDDERLLQTLKFLDTIENQIIIFTCTKREKDLLDKAEISYNIINL